MQVQRLSFHLPSVQTMLLSGASIDDIFLLMAGALSLQNNAAWCEPVTPHSWATF